MSMNWNLVTMIPPGLILDGYEVGDTEIVVRAHSASGDAACPGCGVMARGVHSRYGRTLHDLPAHGRRVVIQVTVRRFRCLERACRRKTFAEPGLRGNFCSLVR